MWRETGTTPRPCLRPVGIRLPCACIRKNGIYENKNLIFSLVHWRVLRWNFPVTISAAFPSSYLLPKTPGFKQRDLLFLMVWTFGDISPSVQSVHVSFPPLEPWSMCNAFGLIKFSLYFKKVISFDFFSNFEACISFFSQLIIM